MKNLNTLMKAILNESAARDDRTGTGTVALFGTELKWDLNEGFPVPTTKELNFKLVVDELLWFIKGDTNIRNLSSSIWNEWANGAGSIGPMYGAMWRRRPVPLGFRDMVPAAELAEEYKDVVGAPNTKETVLRILENNPFTENKETNTHRVAYVDNARSAWVNMLWTAYGKEIKALNMEHGVLYDENEEVVSEEDCSEEALVSEMLRREQSADWINSAHFLTMPYNFNTEISCKEGHRTQVAAEWLVFENFLKDFSSLPYNEDWMHGGNTVTTYLHGAMVYSKRTTTVLTEDVRALISARMRVYGPAFRPVVVVDQLADAIELIKHNPSSRRIVIDSWDPATLPVEGMDPTEQAGIGHCALAHCHPFLQFFVEDTDWQSAIDRHYFVTSESGAERTEFFKELLRSEHGYKDKSLSLKFTMRSSDVCLGLPFNIACYALLTHMVAQVCGLGVGELTYSGGDTHIYKNHIEQAAMQVEREPYDLPFLCIRDIAANIDDFTAEDIVLCEYQHYGKVKYAISK